MTRTADQIAAAVATLQAQRDLLGDEAVDLAVAALSEAASPVGAQPAAEGHLTQATILFVDVVGSTTLGMGLDPEDIHLLVDGALGRFSAIVTEHRGRVLQYAGDSLLAVFGCEIAHEDDPENAVHCGLAILGEAQLLAQQVRVSHGLHGFNVRVGAHTGPVLLGVGVDRKNSVRGSTVNIAARMEQSAPAGGFRISQETANHVRGLFDSTAQAPLTVKGIDKPLRTHLVERARQHSFQPARRGVAEVTTRLVDRLDEFEQLRHTYRAGADANRAELKAVFLVGEAGIGKTRLLSEFSQWAAQQPAGIRVLTARATERRMGRTYGLLRELLSSGLGMLDSDPAPVAREKWLAAMQPQFARADEAALLGHLLGLDFSAHEALRGIAGEARQIRDRGQHYACEFLHRLAKAGAPLWLLLDDLHWADDASLDFIEHLLGSQTETPLTLVGLMRPTLFERRPAWNNGLASGPHRIALTPLEGRDGEALIDALLARLESASPELHTLIAERAEGNPYYMEELINMLIDQGSIVVAERWRLLPGALDAAQLPTTLTGVLQARVDALPFEQRLCLQHAAVIGAVFWDGSLAALGAPSEAALRGLAARQLIEQRATSSLAGECEYAFKHAALHRVCYDSVLKRSKRSAHAKVAQWLITQSGSAPLELIAEHFQQGGDNAQAIAYWQRAAEDAADRYANAAALAHAQRGLALLGSSELRQDLARRYALHLLVAKVLRTQSEHSQLPQCLDALTQLADRLGEDALRSEAAERRARYLSDGGDAAGALTVAQQALAFAPAHAPECSARAQLLIATALSTLGRPDEALPHAQAGLRAASLAGNVAVEAMLLNQMGMDANNRGDPGAAIHFFEQALVRHRQAHNRSNEAGTLANIAYAAFVLGDYEAARIQFVQAAELCQQVGLRQGEGIVHVNLALVLQCQGDAIGARDFAHSALDLLRQAGGRLGEAAALRAAGHAELLLNQTADAAAHFEASRELFDALGLGHLAIEAIAGLAWLCLAMHDLGTALLHVDIILQRQAAGASLAGTDEPLRIGLICHHVLAAAADPRAETVLATAHAELLARAHKISDGARRQAFLDQVPWHRELCRLTGVQPAA